MDLLQSVDGLLRACICVADSGAWDHRHGLHAIICGDVEFRCPVLAKRVGFLQITFRNPKSHVLLVIEVAKLIFHIGIFRGIRLILGKNLAHARKWIRNQTRHCNLSLSGFCGGGCVNSGFWAERFNSEIIGAATIARCSTWHTFNRSGRCRIGTFRSKFTSSWAESHCWIL